MKRVPVFKRSRFIRLIALHDATDSSEQAQEHEAIHDEVYLLLGKQTTHDEEHEALEAARATGVTA